MIRIGLRAIALIVGVSFGVIVGQTSYTPCETEPPIIKEEVIINFEPIIEEVEEVEKVYYEVPLDHELQDYIRELCEDNNLPMSLVLSVIQVESGFQANVISKTNDYGLMQINKINHEWLSEKYGITDFLDPYQNVFCGIEILSQHYSKYENIDKALMAYNLGATGARRKWDSGVYSTPYTRKVNMAMEVYDGEI